MTDRTAIISTNGRETLRGLSVDNDGALIAWQSENEDLDYVLDLTNWLGSDTIASVTRTADGNLTVAGTSNTTTSVTQRLNGDGHVDVKATTAASRVYERRIRIVRKTLMPAASDY